MRDLDKTIETMKPIPGPYDLTCKELRMIYELSRKDLFMAFAKCFRYGFELGRREERNRRKKKHMAVC